MINENMRVKAHKERQVLKIGDIMYVFGYRSSKVEIVGNPNEKQVNIKYLTAPIYKPHLKGTTRLISRQCLYPNGGR
jgi:hypothetical protein